MTNAETPDMQDAQIYGIDEQLHATGQWNAIGTVIGCACDWCEAKIAQLEGREFGHEIKGL